MEKCKCEEIRKREMEETARYDIIYIILLGLFTFWFLGFVKGYIISSLLYPLLHGYRTGRMESDHKL